MGHTTPHYSHLNGLRLMVQMSPMTLSLVHLTQQTSSYANGYLSQCDQFTAQVEPIASTVPYMVGSGSHKRDWPGSGSFYGNLDSGGECGVPAQNMFYVPAENREQFWYSTDYGMFRFCVSQYRVGLEARNGAVQKQPWLIFLAHRVLGYSSATFYTDEGTTEEPMGHECLQPLW
ncbi:putative inactive purple acid phosphatase 1 [Zea mays]|uniref:Putative inactive purple acid phosphatase 1 n=2 Tax=Zea mays TaxID=4577 RepID=A0A1D6Q6F2_MAIZE|nr:putative inactive purple acid phosphatase 1 [Zea mays]AQK89148.1 putative inactive purple acid phosphatase 1 [Zea mays]ONL97212.1 putative inactive purple acid phosphatase 1 [Zea mays]PWZ07727.1 putative inactive purple acid phosphatase 1 [Zea mays]